MDTKIDRRKNAEPYKPGTTPSARSEYFGKSYAQLRRESKSASPKSKALAKKAGKKEVKARQIDERYYEVKKK